MNNVKAMEVLACGEHLGGIIGMMDLARVEDWTVVAATQSRRRSYLQNVHGHHPDHCFIVRGFAPSDVIDNVLKQLAVARTEGTLCPACVAYVWDARPALPACVALDPVSDEVVDCELAPSAVYDGTTFHFQSTQSRETFLKDPDAYVERQRARCIGRRDLVVSN